MIFEMSLIKKKLKNLLKKIKDDFFINIINFRYIVDFGRKFWE